MLKKAIKTLKKYDFIKNVYLQAVNYVLMNHLRISTKITVEPYI